MFLEFIKSYGDYVKETFDIEKYAEEQEKKDESFDKWNTDITNALDKMKEICK